MKGYTREERLKAQKEAFEKSQKKGGFLFYLSDEELMVEKYDIKYFKPKAGPIYIGILPRVEDPSFYLEIFAHYNVGPANNAFLCPERMYGTKCPVCDYREQLKKDNEDDEIVKEFYPRKRNLLWVVNMKDKRTLNEGPMLYDAPPTVISGIAGIVINERTGEIEYDVVEDKINIVFKRVGEKLSTTYGGFKIEDRELEIPDDYYDLPDIESLLIQPDMDEMIKSVGGTTEGSDVVDDEEPKRGRRGRAEEPTGEENTIRGHRHQRSEEEQEEPSVRRSAVRRKERVEEEPEEKSTDTGDDFPFEDGEKEEVGRRVRGTVSRRRSR